MPIIVSENLTKLRFSRCQISPGIDSKLDESQLKNTKPFVEFPCLQQRYLVSGQIQFKLLCCQDKAKTYRKAQIGKFELCSNDLKQPIEYWRTFQYTMSIAQNAMQIERVECSEHLKTSGIRSIFSKCKIWTVFVHDLCRLAIDIRVHYGLCRAVRP
ncbi:Hypothetical_protein [Hexamita inflata]|uniref:Hypothetical_protein n=1 Tax=Hexamita inflata TaxID=28002 RepID=A0AA86UWJ9_9EUKA|nr:Hypothetical protein HINF_LOCUS55217 [Hexamita inflata]